MNLNSVTWFLPEQLRNIEERPRITYRLGHTIRNSIMNYKQTIKAIHIQDDGTLMMDRNPCDCIESPFCDEYHGHIVTGDLRIIKNSKLRKLFIHRSEL